MAIVIGFLVIALVAGLAIAYLIPKGKTSGLPDERKAIFCPYCAQIIAAVYRVPELVNCPNCHAVVRLKAKGDST